MSFLARCPKCGQFQICVTSVENAINLKCRRCSLVYTPVEESLPTQNVNWSLAMTMPGHEFEPPRAGPANDVVVQNLPSVYPKRRSTKQRRNKRRDKYASSPKIESIPSPPQEFVTTEEAAADPTMPPLEQTALTTTPSPVSAYALPLPQDYLQSPQPVEDDDTEYGLLDLNRTSMAALILLAAGLLLSGLSSLVTVPLLAVGVSLVIGSFGAWGAYGEGRRLLVPVGTICIASIMLLYSISSVNITGSSFSGSAGLPSNELIIIPHPQFANDPELKNAEWVDASKASLSQGGTRVEVIGARRTAKSLLIRLRLSRQAGIPGLPGATFTWDENHKAAIYDKDGKRHEQLSVTLQKLTGQAGPQTEAIDVFIGFDSSVDTDRLRLELPAAAWGGNGALKFAVPPSLMKR